MLTIFRAGELRYFTTAIHHPAGDKIMKKKKKKKNYFSCRRWGSNSRPHHAGVGNSLRSSPLYQSDKIVIVTILIVTIHSNIISNSNSNNTSNRLIVTVVIVNKITSSCFVLVLSLLLSLSLFPPYDFLAGVLLY